MLKENWRLISLLERIGDFFIITFSFFVSYIGRSSLYILDKKHGWGLPFTGEKLDSIDKYYIVLILSIIIYSALLELMGAYSSMRFITKLKLFLIFLFSSFFTFFILSACLFLLKSDLSRSYLVLFCSITSLFLFAERLFVLNFLRWARKRGSNYRQIIISGIGPQAFEIAKEVSLRKELGIKVLAFVNLSCEKENDEEIEKEQKFLSSLKEIGYGDLPIINGLKNLEKELNNFAVDEIIFTEIFPVIDKIRELIYICAEQGIGTSICSDDEISKGLLKSKVSTFGNFSLINFEPPPGDSMGMFLKRGFDVVFSFLCLVILSPLFLIVAIIIKFTSKGPVFFVQKRMGLHGREFKFYKFRSMVKDAEKELEKLKSKNEMKSGPVFKMKNDPRVTTFGKFIRKFSIDELPQLLNVLKGEMSIVGPRPPVVGEVKQYDRITRRRLSMRPGLTCTWQASGRSEINDFSKWVEMDLKYIDNWSFWGDIIIIIKTIPEVLMGRGAC